MTVPPRFPSLAPLSVVLALLLLSALLPGAFATLLQAEGQQVVPAAAAQPIYAAMPIFAAGWAALLLHVGAHLDLGSLLAMRTVNPMHRDVRGGSFGRKRGRGARLRGLDFWEG